MVAPDLISPVIAFCRLLFPSYALRLILHGRKTSVYRWDAELLINFLLRRTRGRRRILRGARVKKLGGEKKRRERKVYWEIGSLDEISCVCSVASVEVISPCARLIPNFLATESGFSLAIWCLKEKQAALKKTNRSGKGKVFPQSIHARLFDRNLLMAFLPNIFPFLPMPSKQ